MTQPLFTIADDNALVALIKGAARRLAIVAPALSDAVADALIDRFGDVGGIDVTIVLDADAEVYRLGYGSIAALEKLRAAASDHHVPLLLQPGIRIAMIAADDELLIFAPTPELIEAGSTSPAKPNAIRLGGAAAGRAAAAASEEIGSVALTPQKAEAVIADLKANPPLPYDLSRAVRVFSAQVRYVELKVDNCRFASRRVTLPRELLEVADAELRDRVRGTIQPFAQGLGKVTVTTVTDIGEVTREIGEEWLVGERTRIERDYTFEVKDYGRVILRQDAKTFDNEIKRLELNVTRYRDALKDALVSRKAAFAAQIVAEFLGRWKERPPARLKRWNQTFPDQLQEELKRIADELANEAADFKDPRTRVTYKDVAPESVGREDFYLPLEDVMKRRGVPEAIRKQLFVTFDAARRSLTPTQGNKTA